MTSHKDGFDYLSSALGFSYHDGSDRSLEIQVIKEILIRESYVNKIKSLVDHYECLKEKQWNKLRNLMFHCKDSSLSVIDSIVLWRSGFNKKTNILPPFLWKNENYLLKMNKDLDFLKFNPDFLSQLNILKFDEFNIFQIRMNVDNLISVKESEESLNLDNIRVQRAERTIRKEIENVKLVESNLLQQSSVSQINQKPDISKMRNIRVNNNKHEVLISKDDICKNLCKCSDPSKQMLLIVNCFDILMSNNPDSQDSTNTSWEKFIQSLNNSNYLLTIMDMNANNVEQNKIQKVKPLLKQIELMDLHNDLNVQPPNIQNCILYLKRILEKVVYKDGWQRRNSLLSIREDYRKRSISPTRTNSVSANYSNYESFAKLDQYYKTSFPSKFSEYLDHPSRSAPLPIVTKPKSQLASIINKTSDILSQPMSLGVEFQMFPFYTEKLVNVYIHPVILTIMSRYRKEEINRNIEFSTMDTIIVKVYDPTDLIEQTLTFRIGEYLLHMNSLKNKLKTEYVAKFYLPQSSSWWSDNLNRFIIIQSNNRKPLQLILRVNKKRIEKFIIKCLENALFQSIKEASINSSYQKFDSNMSEKYLSDFSNTEKKDNKDELVKNDPQFDTTSRRSAAHKELKNSIPQLLQNSNIKAQSPQATFLQSFYGAKGPSKRSAKSNKSSSKSISNISNRSKTPDDDSLLNRCLKNQPEITDEDYANKFITQLTSHQQAIFTSPTNVDYVDMEQDTRQLLDKTIATDDTDNEEYSYDTKHFEDTDRETEVMSNNTYQSEIYSCETLRKLNESNITGNMMMPLSDLIEQSGEEEENEEKKIFPDDTDLLVEYCSSTYDCKDHVVSIENRIEETCTVPTKTLDKDTFFSEAYDTFIQTHIDEMINEVKTQCSNWYINKIEKEKVSNHISNLTISLSMDALNDPICLKQNDLNGLNDLNTSLEIKLVANEFVENLMALVNIRN